MFVIRNIKTFFSFSCKKSFQTCKKQPNDHYKNSAPNEQTSGVVKPESTNEFCWRSKVTATPLRNFVIFWLYFHEHFEVRMKVRLKSKPEKPCKSFIKLENWRCLKSLPIWCTLTFCKNENVWNRFLFDVPSLFAKMKLSEIASYLMYPHFLQKWKCLKKVSTWSFW